MKRPNYKWDYYIRKGKLSNGVAITGYKQCPPQGYLNWNRLIEMKCMLGVWRAIVQSGTIGASSSECHCNPSWQWVQTIVVTHILGTNSDCCLLRCNFSRLGANFDTYLISLGNHEQSILCFRTANIAKVFRLGAKSNTWVSLKSSKLGGPQGRSFVGLQED